MKKPTLLFVHGTGVRLGGLETTLAVIRAKVAEFKIDCDVDACSWGNVFAVDFKGLSLPEPPERSEEEELKALRWASLQINPLVFLQLWCNPDVPTPRKPLGTTLAAEAAWDNIISAYETQFDSHVELKAMLEANHIDGLFRSSWKRIVATGMPAKAFKLAGDEDGAVSRDYAEAVLAQMVHDAASKSGMPESQPIIPPTLAEQLTTQMLYDWKQKFAGIKDLFLKLFGKAAKYTLRPLRADASKAIAPAIGDILRYQVEGVGFRRIIREKIETIDGPVFLLAHSLGGIACFELMVEARGAKEPELANVRCLITAGSQAPMLYELGALQTLRRPQKPPTTFPRWRNLYDGNDVLSYRADRLFDGSYDIVVDSMLPPLEAHSAYWKMDTTWNTIQSEMLRPASAGANQPGANAPNV